VLLYRCYAKVNLTLEVLGRRDDGFHDLASVVHTIDLADDLRIEPADELITRVQGLPDIEDNLVARAAALIATTKTVRAGAQLTLVKRIPMASGLGGGSSDAATTLVGLNRLWRTRIGYQALARLAAQLGSDVPFFLRGGAALMRGRGEVLEPLPALPRQWLVLVVPDISLPSKTRALYESLSPDDFSSGQLSDDVARRLEHGIQQEQLRNAFERAARLVFPGLADLWSQIEQSTERRFALSGAGPTLFTLASSKADAHEVAKHVQQPGALALTARTVRHARASIEYP
jgi:4-diphosphocytidyl-2-C-methyl-D-erythritol kinase